MSYVCLVQNVVHIKVATQSDERAFLIHRYSLFVWFILVCYRLKECRPAE